MPDDCFICQRIALIKSGQHPTFVAEMQTCYVVLGDFHAWRGYTLVLSKVCASELHDLPQDRRDLFLREMATAAHAVWNVFRPAKLNYEMLGNLVPHMHWHLFPRYADDPQRARPVWFRHDEASKNPQFRPRPDELNLMILQLREEIARLKVPRPC